MTCNDPLLAMNALKQKQAAIAAEQEKEKKAVATVEKFRIRKEQPKVPKKQPISGHGIKFFGEDNPIYLDLEKKEVQPWASPTDEWYPTEKALTNLLNTYEPLKKYIPDMPKVEVEKSTGGQKTGAMFLAYRKDYKTAKGNIVEKQPLFFLKISSKSAKSITEKLDNLQKGPVGRLGLKALSNPDFPIIVLQEMFFIYKDKDNTSNALEVMHLAHGEQLSRIVRSQDLTLIQRSVKKTGRALGLFHVYFMNDNNSSDPEKWKTMVHGDFHLGNVFFDDNTSRVYFIDNGDMRIGEPSIDFDLLDGLSLRAIEPPSSIEEEDPTRLRPEQYADFILNFLKGYLSAYPLDKRKIIATYLRKLVEQGAKDRIEYNATVLGLKKVPKHIQKFLNNLDTMFSCFTLLKA